MASSDLTRDRASSTALQSIAVRHVVGDGDQAATADALCAALDSDEPSGPEFDAAMAELRPRVTPRGLNMAAAVLSGDPRRVREFRLLVLLGADPAEARRLWAERLQRPTWDPGNWAGS